MFIVFPHVFSSLRYVTHLICSFFNKIVGPLFNPLTLHLLFSLVNLLALLDPTMHGGWQASGRRGCDQFLFCAALFPIPMTSCMAIRETSPMKPHPMRSCARRQARMFLGGVSVWLLDLGVEDGGHVDVIVGHVATCIIVENVAE
jgi:hypothetical protein